MKRYKTVHRLFAAVLSLILMVSMIPATVYAENTWGGTGAAEVQKYPSQSENILCAMGNNLVLQDGGNGCTKVYYADASGSTVGNPIDLNGLGINGGSATGSFDLTGISLAATYNSKYNNDENAFANLDVVLRMEGGTLPFINSGNANARANSITVWMSGGTLTEENSTFRSAIAANTYISGGRIEKNQSARFSLYLSGSPSIGGNGSGITVGNGQKFYLDGILNGAEVYVVPQSDFADGTVIAEGSDYHITENDISQLHLTGDYVKDKELYLDDNAVKIRTKTETAYDVWVGGIRVTEANAMDVLEDGTVSYDASTNTLTLKGMSLTDQGYEATIQGEMIYTPIFSQDDLNIVLAEGSTNSISTTGAISNGRVIGIASSMEDGSAGKVSVTGKGTLSVTQTLSSTTTYAAGIFGGTISVTDASLKFNISGSGSTMGIGAETLTVQNAEISCSGAAYGLVSTDSLSVSYGSNIKATGSIGALSSAGGTISVGSGLTILGSTVENNFENLTGAQISSDGKNIVVGSDTAKTVEIKAAPEITYLDEAGGQQTLTNAYTAVASDITSWSTGWYVVNSDVTINSSVTVNGDVKLILKDGAALTVKGGINVPSGSTFTVYGQQEGTGNLTAIGADGNAGIGGTGTDVDFGTIILAAKGKIVATGDTRAAGIGGGGQMNNNQSVNGTIHIYRGTIEAAGGRWAAGIGGGADSVTNCTIIIDGGIITAQGGENNVGIGGTEGSKTITINGGTIIAIGNGAGAGIGGSYNASGGTITITGGNINAGSIGGGSADGGGSGGTIVVSGGVVTAERIGAGGSNTDGTFSTTQSGDAVIFAGVITDQSGKNSWSGLVFENNEGTIYGTGYTVDEDLMIPADYTLTIESGKTLTVENNVTLTNYGTIKVNSGGVYSGSQPSENKITYQITWDTDGDGEVDGTTYAVYGEMPVHEDGSKAGDAQYSYTFTGWSPALTEVSGTAAYTAQFTQSLNQYEVTLPAGDGYTVTTTQSTTVEYGENFVFMVTVREGYSKTGDFVVKANGTALTAQPDGSYQVNVTENTTLMVEGVADITPPNGDIKIKENSVKQIINAITFGIFFNENVDVMITAEDAASGVASIQYYRSEDILTEDQVASISEWKDYSSISETAEDAKKVVYYVKVMDYAGNISCFGSNGITFDLTAPDVTGVTDGATYYTTQSVMVSDTNLKSVTVNGKTVGDIFTLEGDRDVVYTVAVADQAGNVTSYKVIMKPIESLAVSIEDITTDNVTSSDKADIEEVKADAESVDLTTATEEEKEAFERILDNCISLLAKIEESAQAGSTENIDKVSNITTDNVKLEDKDDLNAAKDDLENALENYGDNYTEKEKAALEEKLEQIKDALESIEQVEGVKDAIDSLPETVEPDDTQTEAMINAAKEQYEALSEYEKSLIPDELKQKLECLLSNLGDYRIIEGNGSQWTVGSDGSITLTANGAFEKFIGIKVDGKNVAKDSYTAKAGSTIITLSSEYLSGLSTGRHTLTVLYTDGQADGWFEIWGKAESETPRTGDSSNVLLWIVLVLVVACTGIRIVICRRRQAILNHRER